MKLFTFLQWQNVRSSELQIIFESNAYLRPNFLLNADFQISKSVFTPVIFRNAEREGITVSAVSEFLLV